MDGWNTTFLLGRPIFRGYVSFREGKMLLYTILEMFWILNKQSLLRAPTITSNPTFTLHWKKNRRAKVPKLLGDMWSFPWVSNSCCEISVLLPTKMRWKTKLLPVFFALWYLCMKFKSRPPFQLPQMKLQTEFSLMIYGWIRIVFHQVPNS